tara:strand:- start:268 stop:468 length:201 start_codon:yes stop_codon:yes gene_type:complete
MNSLIKAIRHIHVQEINKYPPIFQAIISYEPKPYLLDPLNDELEEEYHKELINKLVEDKWFRPRRN